MSDIFLEPLDLLCELLSLGPLAVLRKEAREERPLGTSMQKPDSKVQFVYGEHFLSRLSEHVLSKLFAVGCTPKGSYRTRGSKKGSLTGILRRALQKVLRRVLRWCLAWGF